MLGWHITVYRPAAPGPLLDCADVPALAAKLADEPDLAAVGATLTAGPTLAVWQADLHGIDWIDDLVENNLAMQFAGNGYPSIYAALARDIIPHLRRRPPGARSTWISGEHDVIGPGWHGKTVIEAQSVRQCGPTDWLTLEVWDES